MADGESRSRSGDRFSNLPDHLRENILERLPIKEAVRTDILSRKWRYCWAGMTSLVFDREILSRKRATTPSAEDKDNEEQGTETPETKYQSIVGRVLSRHSGLLQKCVILIPKHFEADKLIVSSWLRSLSRIRVQQLTIDAYDFDREELNAKKTHWLSIPSCFFSCNRLTDLCLSCCHLKIPKDIKAFIHLTRLDLNCVKVSLELLGKFISQCQKLEELSLTYVCRKSSCPLVLNAPSLKIFDMSDYSLVAIIFENVPRLTHAAFTDFGFKKADIAEGSFKLICSLQKVEELVFYIPLLESFGGVRPKVPSPFMHLRTLTLSGFAVSYHDDILVVFCLLRSSPNLEFVNISILQFFNEDNEEVAIKDEEVAIKHLETEGMKYNNLNNLRSLKIENLLWTKLETAFVKVMLSICPILETLILVPDDRIDADIQSIKREVMQLPRLSSEAKVICSYTGL